MKAVFHYVILTTQNRAQCQGETDLFESSAQTTYLLYQAKRHSYISDMVAIDTYKRVVRIKGADPTYAKYTFYFAKAKQRQTKTKDTYN